MRNGTVHAAHNSWSETEKTLVDQLLEDQGRLSAVDRFSAALDEGHIASSAERYQHLLPTSLPARGQQYAFSVDLEACSGCKACVTACHALNGLEETETWRSVGLLATPKETTGRKSYQHVTTACHHCVDPACLNGCPVLAYDKDPVTGIVRHLDDQCIGCQYCIMKCPYEVPKYSERLGVVRKCDMCTNRLSVGEAPACAQACPNEAISITVVDQQSISQRFSNAAASNAFLPSTPDPRITRPTTQYLSSPSVTELHAVDEITPRLEPAHWPLIGMLLLTQAAAGTLMVASVASVSGYSELHLRLGILSFVLLQLGLVAAGFHLGQPLRAWRSFLGWRRSWLSREIIGFSVAVPCIAAPILSALNSNFHAWVTPTAIGASLMALLGVGMSAMVYIDTKRSAWSTQMTVPAFLSSVLQLGCLFSAAVIAQAPSVALPQPGTWIRVLLWVSIATRLIHGILQRLSQQRALSNVEHPRYLNAVVQNHLLRPQRKAYLAVSVFTILLCIISLPMPVSVMGMPIVAATLVALAAEILDRYCFFVGGMARRMPGGIGS